MSNIILTTECPRKCKYCFAKDNQEDHMQFDMENFKKVVDWLLADDYLITRTGLLGGEPTTHSQFIEFLDYLLSKRLSTVVFTNGMVEDDAFYQKVIETAQRNEVKHVQDLVFCVNINEEKYRGSKEKRLQHRFLSNLGRVSTISFNIFEPDFNPYFLIDTIKEYKLFHSIRLGLAAPLGNRNDYLDPDFYRPVAEKLIEFGKEAYKANITIGFDCGFTRCMFYEEVLKELNESKSWKLSFDCGPTIDIYPNLEVSSCYPLSKVLRTKMKDWERYADLYEHWIKETINLHPIYNRCLSCDHYSKMKCSGGCRAHRANG